VAIFLRCRFYPDDGVRNVLGSHRRFLNVSAYFRSCVPLLIHSRINFRSDVAHFGNGIGDAFNRHNGAARDFLDMLDLGSNLLRCVGSLIGKVFDLGSDNGEAFTGFPGPRRFD